MRESYCSGTQGERFTHDCITTQSYGPFPTVHCLSMQCCKQSGDGANIVLWWKWPAAPSVGQNHPNAPPAQVSQPPFSSCKIAGVGLRNPTGDQVAYWKVSKHVFYLLLTSCVKPTHPDSMQYELQLCSCLSWSSGGQNWAVSHSQLDYCNVLYVGLILKNVWKPDSQYITRQLVRQINVPSSI